MRWSRHAAALALLGWYLLIPPSGADKKLADTSAPFSWWNHNASYDTAKACEGDLLEMRAKFSYARRWVEARCIASDDPRFKSK